jgi:hypothetical protein
VIKSSSKQSTQDRPHEVNPEIAGEICGCYARAKAASWIDRCARVVDAGDLDDEEREANADGGDEGVFGLFGGEHQDGEDQVGGEELSGEEENVSALQVFRVI